MRRDFLCGANAGQIRAMAGSLMLIDRRLTREEEFAIDLSREGQSLVISAG